MKWHAEYGPIIRVRMGVQNFIFISDPYLANKIFSGFGAHSSGRPYSTFVAKQYSSDGE
jgi:hypothetical protein